MDPSWATTESKIQVRASKKFISRCDVVKIRMDAEEGLDPSKDLIDISWNIHITDMDIDENLNFMLQKLINESKGKPIFILDHNFTQKLQVGSFVKIVGYAEGKDGAQVMDMEIVEVRN